MICFFLFYTCNIGTIYLAICKDGALFEPLHLFHKRAKSINPIYSSSISEAFKEADIPFTCKVGFTSYLDVTPAIKDDFVTLEQQCLFTFLTRSDMDSLDNTIKKYCIDYFKQIARGKPEKYLLDFSIDYFFVHGHK